MSTFRRKERTWARFGSKVQKLIDDTKLPPNIRVEMRGSVNAMHQSFLSFGVGLLLAIVLVYLILMAQFASFVDPFIILLAIPSGITGVILFLLVTHTTLNVMSLMGVLMMTGIVVSNSILIVDVTRTYREGGMPIREAVALACRVRLRPDSYDLAGHAAGTCSRWPWRWRPAASNTLRWRARSSAACWSRWS